MSLSIVPNESGLGPITIGLERFIIILFLA